MRLCVNHRARVCRLCQCVCIVYIREQRFRGGWCLCEWAKRIATVRYIPVLSTIRRPVCGTRVNQFGVHYNFVRVSISCVRASVACLCCLRLRVTTRHPRVLDSQSGAAVLGNLSPCLSSSAQPPLALFCVPTNTPAHGHTSFVSAEPAHLSSPDGGAGGERLADESGDGRGVRTWRLKSGGRNTGRGRFGAQAEYES